MYPHIPDNRPEPNPEDDPGELSHAELVAIHKQKAWAPDPEAFSSFLETEEEEESELIDVIPSIAPSQFTEFAFRMPRMDGRGYENFTFEGRRHMRRPYDTPAKKILLFCARQVEKSTLLGNSILTHSCLIPAYKTLYVSPSATQTKVFSNDRIKEPIETSSILKSFTTNMVSQNILEKQFSNRAKITLRFAFLNADRCRGIPAYQIALDELQDILADNIPVIEQCAGHAPPQLKKFIYSGTPKGLDNPLEYYRSGTAHGKPMSTQGEWMVPCDRCGSSAGAGRYWNILSERSIGRKSLICDRCGKEIFPMHPDSQWVNQVQDGIFESYRIPQLMVPWRSHQDILLDYTRYSRDKFYNEVLGLSFDSGMRPITMGQLQATCSPDITMHPEVLEKLRILLKGSNVYAGLDWGTGENSYTVLSLGYYDGMVFKIFFIHRFTGVDTDPEIQLEKIRKILHAYNVRIIACDYGGGFNNNSFLVRRFGGQRVHTFQYLGKVKKRVEWDGRMSRWKVHRTEVMSAVFSALKRQKVLLPRWEEFHEPYGQDVLNIFTEYNQTQHMLQYQHRPDRPDDAFHSILYCFLGSMIIVPRPDIINPRKENAATGMSISGWSGPTNQS